MARRPTKAQAAAAREAARREAAPIRFVEDYDHHTLARTTAYKAGMVLTVPPEHRKAALEKGKAVIDGD